MGEEVDRERPTLCVIRRDDKADRSPINNIAQTFAHPQAIARKVVEEVEVGLPKG